MGVIEFEDLKNLDIYIDITPEAKRRLFGLIKTRYRTLSGFADEVGLPLKKRGSRKRSNDLDHFFAGHKIPVSLFLRIIEPFSELSDEYIQKNITRLGSKRGNGDLRNPKFPFDFRNEYGVTLISAILHDGGISSAKSVNYRNNELIMRRMFISAVEHIFGDINHGEYGTAIIFPRILGEILGVIGLKGGEKVILNPTAPEFIFWLKAELKAVFLRQAFDDEGCVGDKIITFCSHVDVEDGPRIPNIILTNERLLKDLGIGCSSPRRTKIYKASGRKRERWVLYITGKRNLLSFKEKVDFSIKSKSMKLAHVLDGYKQQKGLQNETFNKAVEKAREIEHLDGSFTILSLEGRMNKGYHHTKQLVWRMERTGLVKRITEQPPIRFTFIEEQV